MAESTFALTYRDSASRRISETRNCGFEFAKSSIEMPKCDSGHTFFRRADMPSNPSGHANWSATATAPCVGRRGVPRFREGSGVRCARGGVLVQCPRGDLNSEHPCSAQSRPILWCPHSGTLGDLRPRARPPPSSTIPLRL